MVSGLFQIGSYTFPHTVQEFNSNFSDVVPLTQRIIGMDGGIDLDGDEPSPTQIGRITHGFWLIASTREQMEDYRDQVKRLSSLGRLKLQFQPTDPTDAVRTLWGKINYAQMPEQKGLHTDLWQRVQLTIQAAEPVWKSSAGYDWSVCDDGSGSFEIANGSYTLDQDALEFTFTSTPEDIAIQYPGTAFAYPTLALTASGTRSLSDWSIKRILNGQVVDELRYDDIIVVSAETSLPSEFTVDAGRKLALWNGKRAWGPKLYYRHPDLMRFAAGGENPTTVDLQITGTVGGATGNIILRIWYEDTWR